KRRVAGTTWRRRPTRRCTADTGRPSACRTAVSITALARDSSCIGSAGNGRRPRRGTPGGPGAAGGWRGDRGLAYDGSVFGLVLLGVSVLVVGCQLVVVLLRRPAQRAALPGLLRSPVALVDAGLAALVWIGVADRGHGRAAWVIQIVAAAALTVV